MEGKVRIQYLNPFYAIQIVVLCIVILTITSGSTMAERKDSGQGKPDRIVVTEKDIDRMKVHTLVELLNRLPGISATESSVSFRGSHSKQILVLLDGRPLNNPADPHRAVDLTIVSLKEIERIEIYKGIGSVLYGDDTSGGVVSIITKKASKGAGGNIQISYGRFHSEGYELNYRQSLGKFGTALSAGWDKTDGFRKNGDKDKKRGRAKISYESDREHILSLSFDYSTQDRGSPGPTYSPTPHARAEEENWGGTFLWVMKRLKSSTHYSSFEKKYQNPDTNLDTQLKSWSLAQDFKGKITLGRFGPFNLGASIGIDHVEGNKLSPNEEEKYAFYATKQFHWNTIPISLNIGVRTAFYSNFPSVVNPQIEIGYNSDKLEIQLSITRSNNVPTFHQRYYESTYTKPNPDLEMEKATNYSLSMSSTFGKSIEGSVSFFINDITDRITYIKEDGGISSYYNVGSVTRKGVEVCARWVPDDRWLIKSSYTYLLAKDETTGKILVNSPEHTMKLDIQYRPFQDLLLGLHTLYVSTKYVRADNSESIPDYSVSDFRIDYSFKTIKVFLRVDNLLDREYEMLDGYPGAPRTWTAGLNYEF